MLFELLAQLLLEMLVELFPELLLELVWRSHREAFEPRAEREPVLAFFGYAWLGAAAGALSLVPFPHAFVHGSRWHEPDRVTRAGRRWHVPRRVVSPPARRTRDPPRYLPLWLQLRVRSRAGPIPLRHPCRMMVKPGCLADREFRGRGPVPARDGVLA